MYIYIYIMYISHYLPNNEVIFKTNLGSIPLALQDLLAASMQLDQVAASRKAPLEMLDTNWLP